MGHRLSLYISTKPEARTPCKFIARRSSHSAMLTFIRRGFVIPQVDMTMAQIEVDFAAQQAVSLGSSGSVSASLLTNAPLAVVNPLAFTLDNVRPFDSAM